MLSGMRIRLFRFVPSIEISSGQLLLGLRGSVVIDEVMVTKMVPHETNSLLLYDDVQSLYNKKKCQTTR